MKTFILIIAVITLTGFIFGNDLKNIFTGSQVEKKEKKKKKNKDSEPVIPGDVTIKEKWDLPEVLLEVSGIAFLDNERFACVQDEKGTIYIYNTGSNKIEKEIEFTGIGDFEGITVQGNTAYVVRADGILYEVDMETKKTNEYKTGLTIENNIEGLCYDGKNNRLLMAGKDGDAKYPGYKVIYGFDLVTKSMIKQPVYKIDLSDKLLNNNSSKKSKSIMPSALAINPATNEIYITDGTKSRLYTMDSSAVIKKVYELGNEFFQPEGITFSPQADLYISNEGKKVAGNIIQLELK